MSTIGTYSLGVVPEPSIATKLDSSVTLLPDWELLARCGLNRNLRQWLFPFEQPAWWHNMSVCVRDGCPNPSAGHPLCGPCMGQRHDMAKESGRRARDITVEEFLEDMGPRPRTYRRALFGLRQLCLVCRTAGHERPVKRAKVGLCHACDSKFIRAGGFDEYQSVQAWHTATQPTPYPTLGRCVMHVRDGVACPDWAEMKRGLCSAHNKMWKNSEKDGGIWDAWVREPRMLSGRTPLELLDLAQLTATQFLQVCWNTSEDLHQEKSLQVEKLITVVRWLSQHRTSLLDLGPDEGPGSGPGSLARRWMLRTARAASSREQEVHRDVVRLAVLDPRHSDKTTVYTSDITQPWLREGVARRLLHATSEGKGSATCRNLVNGARWWSRYLRTLPGEANDPSQLTETITCAGFASWLTERRKGYLEWLGLEGAADPGSFAEQHRLARANFLPSREASYAVGEPHDRGRRRDSHLRMSASKRYQTLIEVQALLRHEARHFHDHDAGWTLNPHLIPSIEQTRALTALENDSVGVDRALPLSVLTQVTAALPSLGEGQPRNLVEFIKCTGRRTLDTVEGVRFDCLIEREYLPADGQRRTHHWLSYTDRLKDGQGGHPWQIPLYPSAVNVVRRQQDYLRRAHPEWFDEDGKPLNPDLRLFPTTEDNPRCTKGLGSDQPNTYLSILLGKKRNRSHREITPIAEPILGPDGEPFPLARITAYSLRHSFGQQLWDAGVAIDTIQYLMGHTSIESTQVYAKPNDAALIDAVMNLEKLRVAAIDEQGEVVMLGIPGLINGHDQITDAVMHAGACANKSRCGVEGISIPCTQGGDCPNCTDWRNGVQHLPALKRERRIAATAVASYEAGLTPRNAKTTNAYRVQCDHVDTFDQVITNLLHEIDTTQHLTDEARQQVHAMLVETERVELEILEPLGQRLGTLRLPTRRGMVSPLAAQEATVDLTEQPAAVEVP